MIEEGTHVARTAALSSIYRVDRCGPKVVGLDADQTIAVTAPAPLLHWPIWRVFLTDVLECRRCSGRMEIVVAVTSRDGVVRILEHMGLPSDAPAFHPPRPPPQVKLSFGTDVSSGFDADPPARDDFER